MSKTLVCPPDRVIVRDGKVKAFEQWTLFNRTPVKIMTIERRETEYRFVVGGPPQDAEKIDTLENILSMFDQVKGARIRSLFSTEKTPTREELRKMGFKHEIEVVSE